MSAALVAALKQLRMSGSIATLDLRLQEASSHALNHAEFLELVLQDELAMRSDRQFRRLDALPLPLRLGQLRPRRLLRAQPRRSHEDDGVLDVMALEAIERLQVLREDPQSTRIPALQEAGILIGLGLAMGAPAGPVQSAPRLYPVLVLDEVRFDS